MSFASRLIGFPSCSDGFCNERRNSFNVVPLQLAISWSVFCFLIHVKKAMLLIINSRTFRTVKERRQRKVVGAIDEVPSKLTRWMQNLVHNTSIAQLWDICWRKEPLLFHPSHPFFSNHYVAYSFYCIASNKINLINSL